MKHTVITTMPGTGAAIFPASLFALTNRSHLLNPAHTCSYLIGRNILEAILAQEGCEGIRLYNAMDKSGPETFVFLGVNKSNQLILPSVKIVNGESLRIIPIVADKIKPCGTVLDDDLNTDWGIPE